MNRPTMPRHALRALLLLSLWALMLPAQTSSRPGTAFPEGNPGNFTLFRDQQVFVMSPGTKADPWQTAIASFGADLTPTATISNLPWSSSIPFEQVDIQAVAGPILQPDKDNIIIAQRSETDPTDFAIRFLDGSGEVLLNNFQLRIPGWSDFFSVSEGDLDRLYDSHGNYHDEVVAAWMEEESIGRGNCRTMFVPHIAVLNYNGGVDPSVLEQRVNRDDGQYMTRCALQGYNFYVGGPIPAAAPQPVDNILATAVGDFDGDGYNEIALAYMRQTAANVTVISVVIYRYQNDGTNASLTPVNAFDIPTVPNRSMVGTLSLAAGDFDGSGVDQLLVGSAYWWGTPGANGYQPGTFVTQPVLFLIEGGQVAGSLISATSTGSDNASTEFTVSLGDGKYVPRTVTISGAVGSWAAINGTWPVTLTANGFSIAVDSTSFGGFNGQTVQFTAAAPLTQADSAIVDAYPSLPGFSPGPIHIDDNDIDGRIRIQLAPGLFHYDPSNGFDYRRRQIAVAWNARPAPSAGDPARHYADPHLGIIQVTNDDKIAFAFLENNLLAGFQLYQTLSLAAGAFRGDNDTNDPTWSLFLSGVGPSYPNNTIAQGVVHGIFAITPDSTDPSKLNLSRVCVGKASDDPYPPTYYGFVPPICQIWGDNARMDSPTGAYPFHANNYLRLPAIAADLNGNSLRLGAPIHIEITNPGKTDFILEQPPQHSAWLDLGSGPEVVTINRFTSFNTEMQDSEKRDFSSKTTDHTDWNVGGSAKFTASATVSGGLALGPLQAETKTKKTLSLKISYDYNHASKTYSSNYSSYTVGRGAVTGQDDSMIVESQILDLWRYRIYGQGAATGDQNNPNSFYTIMIPGPSLQSNPGGRDVDWYQPVHEVGNILSYPGRTDVCNPSDIGPITIPNTDISNKVIPLIACRQLFYNGNASSLDLSLENTTGKGQDVDYTNKLHGSLDYSYLFKSTFSGLLAGIKGSIGIDINAHGGSDWGQLNTADNSTTGATGITLNSPEGESIYGYPYYPIFYNTTAGGLKVAYGVGDLSASSAGSIFWVNNYGSLPDPALNLPNRFQGTYSPNNILNGWEPVTTIVRKRMKGFWVRNPVVDPIEGDYPLLGSIPHDGDTVMLEARVYNYSVSATPTGPIAVQFSVIPYNPDTNNEICPGIPATGKGGRVCPVNDRTIIGTGSSTPTGGVRTISLNARENKVVYLKWNTKGFGPKTAGVNEYRVYVDLVSGPNGPGELYPAEPPCNAVPCEDDFGNEKIVDPGQNNEGWSLIAVAAPTSNLLGASETNALASATQLSLGAGGTPVLRAVGRVTKEMMQAYLFQPLRLRITAFSNAVSALYGNVIVSDGKPGGSTSKTIAIKTLLGFGPDGSSAWFTWTPRTTGPHHLYAVIQNSDGSRPLGDLFVLVRREPGDLNGDGRVDRHDLNMLNRDLGKTVAESSCGQECDLDGDGKITQKDANSVAQLCDSVDCAFGQIEYVGNSPSAFEPDMRAVHAQDEANFAAYLAANPGDAKFLKGSQTLLTGQALYRTELVRKQGARSIHYYYKGKAVTTGPYASQ